MSENGTFKPRRPDYRLVFRDAETNQFVGECASGWNNEYGTRNWKFNYEEGPGKIPFDRAAQLCREGRGIIREYKNTPKKSTTESAADSAEFPGT